MGLDCRWPDAEHGSLTPAGHCPAPDPDPNPDWGPLRSHLLFVPLNSQRFLLPPSGQPSFHAHWFLVTSTWKPREGVSLSLLFPALPLEQVSVPPLLYLWQVCRLTTVGQNNRTYSDHMFQVSEQGPRGLFQSDVRPGTSIPKGSQPGASLSTSVPSCEPLPCRASAL